MSHNVSLNAARSTLESCAVLLISMQNASPHLFNRIGCLQEVMASRETWKFMVMALICVNLKQLFRHVDATLPKYLIRAYGCNVPVGAIYGINPGKTCPSC